MNTNLPRLIGYLRASTDYIDPTPILLTTPQLAMARGMSAAAVRRLHSRGSRPDCLTLTGLPLWHEDRDPADPTPVLSLSPERRATSLHQMADMVGVTPQLLHQMLHSVDDLRAGVMIRTSSGVTPGWLTSPASRRVAVELGYSLR